MPTNLQALICKRSSVLDLRNDPDLCLIVFKKENKKMIIRISVY